ncbi:MFS transporter [Gammaproteobacteria bacterium AB-CW1]|uniref:MFS transporter n=1 Tax=Natronospira elongata TaxID=3110268 RepID=A0AAP6MMB0_9GAMM|nr:MFS transporter [Gammaproteobacteria bacterium AB-CW1]
MADSQGRRRRQALAERTYVALSGDRKRLDLTPDQRDPHLPGNYFMNLGNGAATRLADQVAGPAVVLPWLLGAMGAPAALVGLLMPVKQTGKLIPQLVVSGWMRRFRLRKGFWFWSGVIQALCLLGMIPAAALLPPTGAALAVVALLGLFSLAGGMGSVAFQDVTGKTIPKGRRGHLIANRFALGGMLTVVAGLLLTRYIGEDQAEYVYLGLIAFGAALWVLSSLAVARIHEMPGDAEPHARRFTQEVKAGLSWFRRIPGFRWFILLRAGLLGVEIATPFYILHSQEVLNKDPANLGLFILAVGVAHIVGSLFWGVIADRSSRAVLLSAALLGLAAGGMTLATAVLPSDWLNVVWYMAIFALLGLGESAANIGRKTWLVDAAPPADRPTWVAFSNTAIGGVALAAGSLGLIGDLVGLNAMVMTLMALILLALIALTRLPAPEQAVDVNGDPARTL